MEALISPDKLIDSLSERNISSPVFDSMHELQASIATSLVAENELLGAWVISQKTLGEINGLARAEGLLGKEVELAGAQLKVPNVQTDLGSAALLATIKEVPSFRTESLTEYQQAHEVRGAFTGFTLDFLKREDGMYQPTVAYQVGFAMHTTPHLTMTVHATGPITSSRLTFAEDEQKDISTDLALSLLEECGNEHWPSIRLIRDASVMEEEMDASRLRHLAYHAEKIANGRDIDSHSSIERNLADMVSLALPKPYRADIVVDHAFQLQDNEQVHHSGNVEMVAPVTSVMFRDEVSEVDGVAELTGRRVLCLISDTKDSGLIYIPALGVSKIRTV